MVKKTRRKKVGKTSRKRNNLWKESVSYLKETRRHIYFAIILFFASSFVGFIFSDQFTFFDELLKGLSGKIEGLGLFGLIWFIFQNNSSGAFFSMIFGAILGVAPVVNALVNGALLGYVFSLASSEAGLGVILYLVPHGIFELPAVFIALGLGMKFGMFVFAGKGRRGEEFRKRFWNSLKVFFTIVLPLLIIAAVIEGFLIFAGR